MPPWDTSVRFDPVVAEVSQAMGTRFIRLRYPGRCAHCGAVVPVGEDGWWDADTKAVRCEDCGHGEVSDIAGKPSGIISVGKVVTGVAGGSARAEYERRQQRRDGAVLARHPLVGRLLLTVMEEPASTRAWARGAIGEERVGAHLDGLVSSGAVVLHDRRIPGTRANIDHIVVASSGVWVIDTKHYHGRVERRDCGAWFRRDLRLYVGGRDKSKLVVGMTQQIDAVQRALAPTNVPIRPVLCFVAAEWRVLPRSFGIDGVLVTGPKVLTKAIKRAKRERAGCVRHRRSHRDAPTASRLDRQQGRDPGSNSVPSVELMGRYSKLDIATKLRAILAGSGRDDLPARTTRSVRRLPRLTEPEVADLVSLRQSGEQIDVLAERFGIGRSTVLAHLQRRGVPGQRWRGRTLPDDQLAEAGRLYATGLNLIAVAQQFGVDRRYLRQALPDAGRLYATGLNLIAVAQQFGVDRRYLRQALPDAGFPIRPGGQQKRQ